MKENVILAFCVLLLFGFVVTSCDNGGNSGNRDIKYSVQVNNQAATGRAIIASDTVELFIANMEYIEDAAPRAMIIIAANDRHMGSKGGRLNNAGWYSVNALLNVSNDVNDGMYSAFYLKISKLRVNGTEYVFPVNDHGDFSMGGDPIDGFAATLGNLVRPMVGENYPDNFSGINITSSVVSLKTILIVDPDIIGTPNTPGYDSHGLADDPFEYIFVEGRVNE